MNRRPILDVFISAFFFGLSIPISKLLLRHLSPIVLVGFLYLGAFLGLLLDSLFGRVFMPGRISGNRYPSDSPLGKKDVPWLAGSIAAGGILGPLCLLIGLAKTSGFAASLLLNFEGAATALLAVFLFKEQTDRRLWLALVCMSLAGIFATWDPARSRLAADGPLWILLAMICWGLDNNLTRNISDKNPFQISRLKGFFSGMISLSLALILGYKIPLGNQIVFALLLGAMSYGLSLVFFIRALRGLGAFRAGSFFSLAPFIGALGSLFILRDPVKWLMLPATALMALGVYLIFQEKHVHRHRHPATIHDHAHVHGDLHHNHAHQEAWRDPHSHEHCHEELDHIHVHWPDAHHQHGH